MGVNIGAGQGFLDFGHSALFLLGGGVAFATMLAFAFHEPGAEPARDDPSPAMALAGMGLLLAGSVGWLLNQPLVDFEAFSPTLVLVNLWLAAAAGSLPYLLLALAGGRFPRPLLAVRGLAAGWVAGWAAAPFAAPGELLLVGLGAGLLSVLASAALQLLSRQHDAGETVAMLGLPAFWGLLAAGIFAPTPGQLQAQLIGAVILFLLAFSVGSVFIVPLVVLTTRTAPEPRRQTEATGAAQREGSVAVEERP
ncbi:MAG: hypothetical protein D6775_14000 [Caldilineae bacterium]|nr:MAG: hypothetical protein D6775_14000 [Caldilineae bacterium]